MARVGSSAAICHLETEERGDKMKVHGKSVVSLCCLAGFLLAFAGAAWADDLNISGNYVVPTEGASYDNVTVSATATVSGGAITLANGGSISVTAGTATFSCPIVLGTAASTGVTIAPASGATARFNGVLSGPADIDINGAGTIYFSGANTFDGDLVITKGVFHAEGNCAFGSTAGTTTLTVAGGDTTAKIYFDSGTWSESFFLSQGGTWGNWTVCFAGACTFNGPVTCSAAAVSQWWRFETNARVVFNGGFNSFGGYYGEGNGSPQVTFNCAVQAGVFCPKTGTIVFNTPIDTAYCDVYSTRWRDNRVFLALRPGTFTFGCVDALGASGNCGRYYVDTPGDTTVNLLEDQHVSHMMDAKTASHIITSEAGKILYVDSQVAFGVSSQGFSGRFTGSAGLAVEGHLPMTLSGVSTTSGSLILTNGAQVAMGADASWSGKIVIADDGGETLTLPSSCSFVVAELWVGGEKMPDGDYGGSESAATTKLSCFGGEGVITVQDPSVGDVAVWTGGGSTTSIADGANWDIGREPGYADGDSVVTFATAGESADVAHDVYWKSVAFSDRSAFALAGTGLISLADGISIAIPADASAARRFTVGAFYRQMSSHTTTVPANTTLAFDAAVSSAAGKAVGFDGAGTVELNAANALGGSLFFSGSVNVLASHPAALGANGTSTAFNNLGKVDLRNVSIAGPVSFSGAKTIVAPQSVTNVFNGMVTFDGSATYIFYSRRRQKYLFRGGLATAGAIPAILYVGWDQECNTGAGNYYVMEIAETPVSSGSGLTLRLNNTYIETVVSVSSNRFGNVEHLVVGNAFTSDGTSSTRLRCAAPYAFNYDSSLQMGLASDGAKPQGGYFDLGGYDQGFSAAVGYQKTDAQSVWDYTNIVHSATPAFLCTRHATAATNRWTFTGAAGYRMEGAGSVTLKAPSASTGELCVTNGTLALAAGCLWPKCSRVTVSDKGAFEIASDGAIGRKTDVALSGDGRLTLAEGVNLRVHSLWIDGVERMGVWGSPESGAAQTDSRLSGRGTICGRNGLAVIFR